MSKQTPGSIYDNWPLYNEFLAGLNLQGEQLTQGEVARLLVKEFGGSEQYLRKHDLVKQWVLTAKGTDQDYPGLVLTEEEMALVREYRGIKTVALETNMPIEDIDFYWDKTKKFSAKVQNRFYRKRGEQTIEEEIDFSAVFAHLKPVEVKKQPYKKGLFDRAVYSDVHVGMTPNQDGYSLYGGKWDEEEINNRLEIFIHKILQEQKSNTLYLDELGDFMDGWDGETVRRGHSLPQNMDNQKAYDVGLSFKIRLVDALIQHYDRIVCHNICNDNHAGAFGYVVNSAFKTVMQYKYPRNVEVHNIRKFIDHYTVGKYVFILTHGKDGKNLKFGFKPVIDPRQIEKITNYIDEHFLYTKDSVIEFSKGDSHQWYFDNSSSDKFNYYNYPAFSPSSEWVQTNFKKGKSGFIIFNYFENADKTTCECLFEWHRALTA